MKYSCVFASLLLFLLIGPPIVNGTEEEPPSLTGRIGIGAMFINSGNNLNPKGSDKNIDDLDSAANKKLTIIPLIVPSLTYAVKDSGGLKFYFDTRPPIDEVGGFAINTGGSYPTKIGIIDTSLYFTPFSEAYKNPYETGVDRASTSTSKYGIKVALNKIMGSNFRINTVYMKDDVDEDVIGDLVPELNRDGNIFVLNANYSFYPSRALELRPRISYSRGQYDGDSNSFNKFKADVELRYRVGRIMMIPRISYAYSEYDETNPIFNETRDNHNYNINILASYMAPFGMRDWAVQYLLGYGKGDSNLTFYDTESITFGAFLTYIY